MREIKFRVWDSERKKILPIQRHSFKTGKSMPYGWNLEYVFDGLMQYTGLKDKNKREVYEGDIIKYSSDVINSFYGVSEIIREVKFKYGTYGIEGFGKDTHIPFGNILKCRFEVIGNIYENPELVQRTIQKGSD